MSKRFKKKQIKEIGTYTYKGVVHTTVIFYVKGWDEMYCSCTPEETV